MAVSHKLFRTTIARQMLQRAFKAGVAHRWVSGDEVYGSDRRLRLWLEEQQHAYVLAASVKEPIWIGFEQYSPTDIR